MLLYERKDIPSSLLNPDVSGFLPEGFNPEVKSKEKETAIILFL